jgi:hypothetical protein
MRLITICSCLLAAGSLLMFSGCSTNYTRKGPEKQAAVVNIADCKADPDTVLVHRNDNLSWAVPNTGPNTDKHTYTVGFKRHPIPESTVTVSANAQDKPHPVKGDLLCNTFGSCLYPYTLTKEDGSVCPDPGVHVIP